MKEWSELMQEKSELIVEKMVEAFKEAEGGMSGWHVGVEMDEDGDVWTTGIMSEGSQSESSWKGETTVIDWIKAWELEYDELDMLTFPENKEIQATFEQAKLDDEDLYFRDWMSDNYPDKLKEWDKDARQCEIDSFEEYAGDKLDDIIRMQKEHENYQEG